MRRRLATLAIRLYPRSWRARYQDELAQLLDDLAAGGGLGWRAVADVARQGLVLRLAADGLAAPLVVLRAWMAVVAAGIVFQRGTEHWQAAWSARGGAQIAYDLLVAAAAAGSAAALAGLAVGLWALRRPLRRDGWGGLARPLVIAGAASVLVAASVGGLVEWAGRLDSTQRNGADPAYGLAAAGAGVLVVIALALWTHVATVAAARLDPDPRLLRLERRLARVVAAAIAGCALAGFWWWAAVQPGSWPLTASVAVMATAAAISAGSLEASARAR